MSETVFVTGKLRKVDLKGKSIKEFKEEELLSIKFDPEDIALNLDECFNDVYYERFIKLNGEMWEIYEENEKDYSENFVLINKNNEGTYDFTTQFYNGGTCLTEMLEDGLNKLEQ